MEKHPRVGVGVFIVKDNKVLLLKRKNSHGDGTWALVGGHLEFGESLEECAKREVLEETGLSIKNVRHSVFTNDIFSKEDKHYITLYAICDYANGDECIMEPDKCSELKWFRWEELPEPLFIPLINLKKTDFNPLNY